MQINNVSRRSFVKGLGLSFSSFVLGVNLTPSLAADKFASSSTFSPHAFVAIDEQGLVTIMVNRVEMGQGIRTSIPMVICDEMAADWQRVNIVQADADEKYGNQGTDGSSSITTQFDLLREVGATCRLMLETAASQLWQVGVSECRAINHQVKHLPTGRLLSFAELVPSASKLMVPDKMQLTFKSVKDYRYIGNADITPVDNMAITTGKAIYSTDICLANMKYAVILRPPVFASGIASFDASKTVQVPGVVKVIQLDDLVEPAAYKPLGGIAVIADNTWAAIKGRDLLQVVWSESRHQDYHSADYIEELKQGCINAQTTARDRGDVSKAFKVASKVVTQEYYTPKLTHVSMEPPTAVAHFQDGKVEIWASSQTPQTAKNNVANQIGIDKQNITLHIPLLGGGFGRKSKPDFVVEAAILSQQTGFPIKLLWTREDDIKNGYFHAPSYQQISAGFDENDRVIVWHHKSALPPIGSTFDGKSEVFELEAMLGFADVPFDIANIRCDTGKAQAHTRIGWMRAVANISHVFSIGCFVNQLAHTVKQDPKEFLLNLIGKPRHIDLAKDGYEYPNYFESIKKHPLDTCRLRNVVEAVTNDAQWQQRKQQGRVLGLAVHRSCVSYFAAVAEVSQQANGKIKLERIFVVLDAGIIVNPERVMSQLEGSVIFGISVALYGNISAVAGQIEQSNFHDYQVARITDTPEISVRLIKSNHAPGGVGETVVPVIAPAIYNAIFELTGQRYNQLPLSQYQII